MEKVTSIVCCCLFRILLPLTLLAASLFRYNVPSLIYLVCLLVIPLLPYPRVNSMAGCTGWFLKAVVGISGVVVLLQIIFHITLVAIATDDEPYGSMLPNCSSKEMIVRQFGFQRMDGVPYYHIIRLLLPDVTVLVVSIIVLVVCAILIRNDTHEEADLPLTNSYVQRRRKMTSVLTYLGEFFVGLLLAASAIMVPSVLSSVYFLVFLVLGVMWACYQSLGNRFSYFRIMLLLYTGCHILILYLYQFQFFQDALPKDDLVARVLGLTGVFQTHCNQVYALRFYPNIRWMLLVNPGVLLLLYWVLAFETRYWFQTKDLPPEEMMEGCLLTGEGRRKKRKRRSNVERQTGSLVFSGSTYGDEADDDEERLVDEGENINYNSMDPVDAAAAEPEAGPSHRESPSHRSSEIPSRRKWSTRNSKRPPLVSLFMFAMRQSYVLMLIAMMAWSIMYLSWLTFILLLGACLLWMLPSSRRGSLVASPLLVLYVICLLLAQYVYNMDLEKELPVNAGVITLAEIGLMRFDTAPKDLAVQILFTMFFLMTLRQFVRERQPEDESTAGYQMRERGPEHSLEPFTDLMIPERDYLYDPSDGDLGLHDSHDGYDSASVRVIGNFLMEVMCKYWIFVCAGMLLLISVQEVVIYRTIYMILFLIFIVFFQVSYSLWRALMFAFWWVVIVYSMAVLIIIYTYQFEKFPGYWASTTGWDNTTLADIGLEKFNGTELFIKLLTPTSFLIIIILQVHYFHKPFMRLSALDRYRHEEAVQQERGYARWLELWAGLSSETETDEDDPQISRVSRTVLVKSWFVRNHILLKMMKGWQSLTRFLWRLAEIHFLKVVIIIVMFVAVQEDEVSGLTAVYVILVGLLMPFILTSAHLLLSHLVVVWTCTIILAKMLYQLQVVPVIYTSLCDALKKTLANQTDPPPPPKSIENMVWLGLEKLDETGDTIDHYIRLYILVLAVLLFESIVRYHQRQYYNHPDTCKPTEGIIFNNIHRPDADVGIVNCLKYFANYAFYKFGLEICYIMTAVTVCIRMDVFGVLYVILLALMMLFSRRTSARIWWLYMLILAILLPVQYMISLGFPALACVVYPWTKIDNFSQLLERWLYLPDVAQNPPSIVLLADVFQLLFITLQWRVFRLEMACGEEEPKGGSNEEILADVEANTKIPVEDFTLSTRTYLDVCKQGVFEYMFWVTLAIVFITGATRVNIFGLGYVIAIFCFMWYGKEFLLKPLRSMLRMWNYLLAYVVFVLFAKASLQLVGCVYVDKLFTRNCWVIQLFGINCLLPTSGNIISDAAAANCLIVEDNTGLTWDVICFAFLLLQRRIYGSHYFRHIVDLLGAQSNLSSRGAELINRILVRQVEKQKEEEKDILMNIKQKMNALKERQAALRKDFKEPTEHFQAIRAGDYYLFEERAEISLDKSVDEQRPEPTSLTFGQQEQEGTKRLGPLQVINTAMDHGAEAAVEQAKQQDEKDGEKSALETAPASPEKEQAAVQTMGSLLATLIGSVADWLIHLCNQISRNYRLVAHKLDGELRVEKERIQSRYKAPPPDPVELVPVEGRNSLASTSNPTFTPDEVEQSTAERENQRLEMQRTADDPSVVDPQGQLGLARVSVTVPVSAPEQSAAGTCLDITSLDSNQSLVELEARAEDQEREFEKSQPRTYRLLVAIAYMLISHSELLCYFLMILDQMVYGSLLSLPLPFMVFLWGMLSVPRPSKTFWITVITYTEAVVVTKYLFQFGFFPWNDGTVQESPFYPPRILGIEQTDNYANVDIALLLALFIHRSILKRYGLWKDSKDISDDLARAGDKERSPAPSLVPLPDEPDMEVGDSEIVQEEEEAEKQPGRIKKTFQVVVMPFTTFFRQMMGSTYDATVDVYAPMFCCDFINFFIVVFGYQSFGPAQQSGDGDVTSYITENRVPVPFLIMLIVQFLLIIIDRALFLRKNVLGKCVFQILLVIVVHIWMFFVLPKVTGRSFFDNKPAQLWYFVKCVYFALSAYQIRCGYPTRILGNFLTKKYNYLNLFLFQGFLAIPFLLELRALMDWIWTDSTLAISSWLQMEDIYANIFVLKCWRHSEIAYPTPRAQKKKAAIKYGVGGLLLFLIILIIWFPLVIFAFANTVFDPNPPVEVTIQLQLGAYQPLFRMTVQQSIQPMSQAEKAALEGHFERDARAVSFLNRFELSDTSVISFSGQSTSIWGISAPAQEEMIVNLRKAANSTDKSIKLEFSIVVIRSSDSKSSDTVTTYFMSSVNKTNLLLLADVINGTSNETVRVDNVFPRFLQISTKGIAAASPLITGQYGFGRDNLKLGLAGNQGPNQLNQYWTMEEEVYGNSHFIYNKKDSKPSFTENIKLVTFNDRKAPSTLSFISGYGIIGLYVSFILLIGRFLRMGTTGQHQTIIFRELPMVDNILQLCLDIYLVREMKEFHLEEDLYAKLIFLYRSPETMIKWTRPKAKTE